MNKEEASAWKEYENIRGYDYTKFKPAIRLNKTEQILFDAAEGDPHRAENIGLSIKRRKVLDYLYRRRVTELNELKSHNAYLNYLKSLNNNG